MRMPDTTTGSTTTRPRLLLVDDDAFSAKSLRLLLTNWGYDVTVAASIAEARAALGTPFDFMILDLMLPDGDGADILRHVRQQKLPTKVTVTTGVSDQDRLKDVRSLQPTEILSKPIDLSKLMSLLR
jgi:two-component system response regulator PilR (NtrC family)